MIIGKTDIVANLGNRKIGVGKHCLCKLHFSCCNIVFQGQTAIFLEKCRDIFFVVSKISSDLADTDRFADAPGNIIDNIGVELDLAALDRHTSGGEIDLAVQFAQDRGENKVILIVVAVFAVAVLQLL